MKKQYMYILSLFLLAACAGQENEDDTPTGGKLLELRVIAGDFLDDGQPSRATEEGTATRFENGDRVGVILVRNGSAVAGDNNLPYKYNNGQWAFDVSNKDGKQARGVVQGMTCLVYYPYSPMADGVATVDELRAKFPPRADQRTVEAYRASDVMAASPRSTSADGTLDVTLAHLHASVSIPVNVSLTLDDGRNTRLGNPKVLDPLNADGINLMSGNEVTLLYRAGDGSFRGIIPAGFNGKIRYSYTLDEKIQLMEAFLNTSAGTRYTCTLAFDLKYTRDMVTPGDFCCQTTDGKVYFVPGEMTPPAVQIQECKGIVFHVRGNGSPEDKGGYDEFNGDPTGYIVSLDENEGQWSTYGHWGDHNSYSNFISGYQQTYKDGSYDNMQPEDIPALTWCRGKAKVTDGTNAVFSKWYMISIKEMYLLADHFDVIQANLRQVGTPLQDKCYFTANRMGSGGYYINLLNPKTLDTGKYNHVTDTYPYRAAVAFKLQ